MPGPAPARESHRSATHSIDDGVAMAYFIGQILILPLELRQLGISNGPFLIVTSECRRHINEDLPRHPIHPVILNPNAPQRRGDFYHQRA